MNRTSRIELTNMCLVYNDTSVLVQEKLGLKEKYKGGLVFPGGHIEENESLLDSVVREIKEETGLTIFHPQPCGFKDWILEDGTSIKNQELRYNYDSAHPVESAELEQDESWYYII